VSRIVVFSLAVSLSLGVAACGGEASQAGPSGDSASAGAPAPSTSTASTSASPAGAAAVVEIKVAVDGGKVVPRPSVHKVRRGQTVRLVVTSDEADELHVHGYDKSAKLPAGDPVTLEFTADQTGRFEVETHESDLQLLQLEVS
jgi:plastocyanin